MMYYGITECGLNRFIAKIGLDNMASLALFEKRLGFTRISISEIFHEVTLELRVTDQVRSQLEQVYRHVRRYTFDPN
jgi:hypothetical protein